MYLRAMGQTNYGTYPVVRMTIGQYEAMRAAAEETYIEYQRALAAQVGLVQAITLTAERFGPGGRGPGTIGYSILPVPYGHYIHDPETGRWYRAGDISGYAWEINPPVVGGVPGTWQESPPMSDAEAAAWIAKVEASRQPFYGSVLTLPSRLGWQLEPGELEAWVEINSVNLGWSSDNTIAFFASFPSRQAAGEWIAQAQQNPGMWAQKAAELFPPPPTVQIPGITPPPPAPPPPAPPPAAPPPPAPSGGYGAGNIAPVGSTPPGHRYPIIQYAPHAGTALLRSRGWLADEIGFWFTQAFGGNLELTESFLLSFSGREELAAWQSGKGPAEVYARADSALASRRAQTPPPGGGPALPPVEQESGISLPLIALLGAGAVYLMRR